MECHYSRDALRSSLSHACGELSDHRETTSAQQSRAESDMDDISLPRHRPRRNAKARREQMRRSYTRMVTRLIEGLTSIREHRGNSLSLVGSELLQTLQPSSAQPQTHQYSNGAAHSRRTTAENRIHVCRHWRAGRCTYGSSCRFAHQDDIDGHAHTDQASDIEAGQSNYAGDVEAGVHGNARHGDASSEPEVYPEDPTCVHFDDSATITRNEDQCHNTDDSDCQTKDHLEHRPDFYHLAACKRTRNMVALFSDAAVAFLADTDTRGRHYDNDDDDAIEQDRSQQRQDNACDQTCSSYGTLGLELDERIISDHTSNCGDSESRDREPYDHIEDIVSTLAQLGPDSLGTALELLPQHLLQETQARLEQGFFDLEDSENQQAIELYGDDCDILISTLLNEENRNQKVARRRYRLSIEHFDDAKVTSMLRHVASQVVEQQRVLIQGLPPECGPLEKLAIRLSYNAFRRGLDLDIAISRALQIVKNDFSSAM